MYLVNKVIANLIAIRDGLGAPSALLDSANAHAVAAAKAMGEEYEHTAPDSPLPTLLEVQDKVDYLRKSKNIIITNDAVSEMNYCFSDLTAYTTEVPVS